MRSSLWEFQFALITVRMACNTGNHHLRSDPSRGVSEIMCKQVRAILETEP